MPRSIFFLSAAGGVGKSQIVVNCFYFLSLLKKSALIVDLNDESHQQSFVGYDGLHLSRSDAKGPYLRRFDFALVDCPPGLWPDGDAEKNCFVSTPSISAVKRSRVMLRSKADRPVSLILNKVGESNTSQLPPREVGSQLNMSVNAVIPYDESVLKAESLNRYAAEFSPKSAFSLSIATIVTSFCEISYLIPPLETRNSFPSRLKAIVQFFQRGS